MLARRVDGDEVRLGGLTLQVEELGPGESHVDTLWRLDPVTVFAADVVYNEILYNDEVPASVAIAEAVEAAKTLSTDESSGFINGLLGRVAQSA